MLIPDAGQGVVTVTAPARIAVACVGAALVSGFGGCGDGNRQAGKSSAQFLISNFPDYLDPQLSYSAEGWEAMWNVYVPLLTYAHEPGLAGAEVIPGLAEDLPEISKDGTVYELVLRDGLEYSDGTPVRASDFERGIERVLDLESPGSTFFADVAGIETDDETGRIRIELTRPRGTFAQELALLYAAPVPAGTPAKRPASSPIPATGPFEIADVETGRSFALKRNPAWARNSRLLPQLPGGQLDEIEVSVEKSVANQTTRVARNEADFMLDPPPSDRLHEVESEYGDRFAADLTGNTYFFWMNTQRAPFDDVRVRRAVNHAIDPEAIAKIYGGLMAPAQQVLPPTVPGFERFMLYPHDLSKARELIAEAKPADTEVTVWTVNQEPNDRAGQYYQDLLEQLGFEAELKTLGTATYFETIGNRSTPELDTGWSNWFQSYPHPNDFFGSMLAGDAIADVHNNNNALFDDPRLNREISALARFPLTEEAEDRYAALDRRVMRQAPLAPYGNLELTTFVSERIDFDRLYLHPVFQHDYTSFAVDD
jgi:peptide/nickel transport system substrate-binding protein